MFVDPPIQTRPRAPRDPQPGRFALQRILVRCRSQSMNLGSRLAASAALLLAAVAPALAANPLDASYGDTGQQALSVLGGYVEGLGSCPHADGSVSVLGYRPAGSRLVILRLLAEGGINRNFSGDGIAELALGAALDPAHSAISCSGVGNADPADDRAMLFATSTGASYDLGVMALVDLSSGSFDPGFYLGGPGFYDLGAMVVPIVGGQHPYPRVRARGVSPGPAGGWLITGQVLDTNSQNPKGFIARVAAAGAVDAISQPSVGGFSSTELTSARVAADGDVRVLGGGMINGTATWGLLRVDPNSLQPVSLSASGPADVFPYRVFKGRQISGGVMVAAGLKNDNSAFGASPRLLIVRGDAVVDLALPAPPSLDGQTVGPSGLDGSASATGALNGRAVFAMGLLRSGVASAGYYAAVVKLGDGAGVADAVASDFGSNGAASFAFLPQPTTCGAGQRPPQRFANIASWGDSTLLVGSIAPDCAQGLDGWVHTAKLATDGDLLLRDNFE